MGAFATKRDLAEAIIGASQDATGSSDGLVIVPCTPEAIPRASDERIIGLSLYLKDQSVVLAEDKRQQLVFYDKAVIHKLLKKRAEIMNSPEFDFDNLWFLLEVEGYCTARIELNSKTGTLDYFSKFQKSWWRRIVDCFRP